jgi:hypothetical protein
VLASFLVPFNQTSFGQALPAAEPLIRIASVVSSPQQLNHQKDPPMGENQPSSHNHFRDLRFWLILVSLIGLLFITMQGYPL